MDILKGLGEAHYSAYNIILSQFNPCGMAGTIPTCLNLDRLLLRSKGTELHCSGHRNKF